MKNHFFGTTINTEITPDGDILQFEMDSITKQHYTRIIQMGDEAVKQKLKELGWTPPGAKNQSLEALKLAYRKHNLQDDSIGWDELSAVLLDALCEEMGDVGFQQWLGEQSESF
jgi:hypothetical protein